MKIKFTEENEEISLNIQKKIILLFELYPSDAFPKSDYLICKDFNHLYTTILELFELHSTLSNIITDYFHVGDYDCEFGYSWNTDELCQLIFKRLDSNKILFKRYKRLKQSETFHRLYYITI